MAKIKKEVEELETYFKSIELPKTPILLGQGEMINDVGKFLESHFATLKHRKKETVNMPFLVRLRKLKAILLAE